MTPPPPRRRARSHPKPPVAPQPSNPLQPVGQYLIKAKTAVITASALIVAVGTIWATLPHHEPPNIGFSAADLVASDVPLSHFEPSGAGFSLRAFAPAHSHGRVVALGPEGVALEAEGVALEPEGVEAEDPAALDPGDTGGPTPVESLPATTPAMTTGTVDTPSGSTTPTESPIVTDSSVTVTTGEPTTTPTTTTVRQTPLPSPTPTPKVRKKVVDQACKINGEEFVLPKAECRRLIEAAANEHADAQTVTARAAARRLTKTLRRVRTHEYEGLKEPLGVLIHVQLSLQHAKGVPIEVRWKIQGGGKNAQQLSREWSGEKAAYTLIPLDKASRGSFQFWVPMPKDAGHYTITAYVKAPGEAADSKSTGGFR
jgi:hypothetical protein